VTKTATFDHPSIMFI